mmetsp:Transcript_2840/g.6097  ORF Transcript_2840/g.6097 Transcript_2840/m.6097 type:complete len:659 (-) Transcript_2840:57-2033(-)
MSQTSSWLRVASGFRLVATNGASRISRAILSNDPQSVLALTSRHLPEVTGSVSALGKGILARDGAGGGIAVGDTVAELAKSPVRDQEKNFTHDETEKLSLDGINSDEEIDQLDDTKGKASCVSEIDSDGRNDNIIATPEEAVTVNSTIQKPTESQPMQLPPPEPQPDYQYTESLGDKDDDDYYHDQDHTHHLPEGTAVPSTRIGRAFGFASLGAGLAVGSVAELARRTVGRFSSDHSNAAAIESSSSSSLVLSNAANTQRLSHSLRRMRGAAMKLGQMLSIQDESIAPPALTQALAQVRKGAEAMPTRQLLRQLESEWGEKWREKVDLEERPFAAASIGQVHRGRLKEGNHAERGWKEGKRVAVKVQYPGVSDSIESDLSNLTMLVKATGLAPPGLFLENVIRVGREELKVECDYRREVENQKRFRSLISSDAGLVADRFRVPEVIEDLCTDKILVTEYVHGGTIDKVVDLDASERNRIGRAILRLTMLELFVWRFMQTDPNWGNFLYDVRTRTTYLIDFGAAREYDEEFVRGYLNIVVANANKDEETLMKESVRMGFLTGEENGVMMEAHKMSGFCLGEPFQSYEPYDFKASRITSRISEHGSVFLRHRLTPPPEEVYTLHRKLAGAYNLCIKLGAVVSCRDLLDEVIEHFKPFRPV